MRISYQVHTVAKRGNRPDENEDAYWPPQWEATRPIRKEFRCAIADGATQASFSRLWARLFVRAATTKQFSAQHYPAAISRAQQQWSTILAGLKLPWHAEEKVKRGAFAALATLRLSSSGRWESFAVGDSCLFQVRGDTLLVAHPIKRAADFGNNPTLISSLPARNNLLREHLEDFFLCGEWHTQDEFILMTDALAAWTLQQIESWDSANIQPITVLIQDHTTTPALFEEWINGLREADALRNDDTTLIWIKVEA